MAPVSKKTSHLAVHGILHDPLSLTRKPALVESAFLLNEDAETRKGPTWLKRVMPLLHSPFDPVVAE